MKNIIFVLQFIFLVQTLSAQFGIRGYYQNMNADNWEQTINRFSNVDGSKPTPLNIGYAVGLDYWFRLKNKRLEFTPEVNYAFYTEKWNSGTTNIGELKATSYSLFLNTNLYLLDFDGDCDCPTFSKDGGLIEKGFFIQFSPGWSYYQLKYDALISTTESREATTSAFSAGLAVGLDIGIIDMITITPIIGFRRHFGVEWEDLHTYFDSDEVLTVDNNKTGIMTFHAGIRLGIRIDKSRF